MTRELICIFFCLNLDFVYFRFVLTFSATAGGFRILRNRDTNVNIAPQYYTEKTTSNIIEFRFDYVSPIHCTEESTPCASKPLHLSEDITQV